MDEFINNELSKHLRDYLDSFDQNPSRSLFHYTSYEGLAGILRTKQLWLSDYKYLNDPSEIEHGKKLILTLMSKHFGEKLCGLPFDFYQEFQSLIQNNYHMYVTSFCKKPDYLPAWRYYGGNCTGYAIGFKKEFFKPDNTKINNLSITSIKVEYSKKRSAQIINDILEIFDRHSLEITPHTIKILVTYLLCILPKFKNPDFKDENEWRFCITQIYNEQTGLYVPPITGERFFVRDAAVPGEIPPFLKNIITISPTMKGLSFEYADIDTIYLGPRLNVENAKPAIQQILKEVGADECKIKIKESKRAYQ